MSTTALSLVIAGALIHALWNLLAKKAAGGLPFVWLFGIVSLIVALPFGIYAGFRHAAQLNAVAWLAIASSAVVHAVYSLILQKGYRESHFSLVYPLARGTGPLFAVLGAILLLGETPNLPGWLGIFAIVCGVLLISDFARTLAAPTPLIQAGLLWGGLTGLCIAAYTLIDGWAIKRLGLAPILYYFLGLCLRTALLTPQALLELPSVRMQWQRNRRHIIAVGILSPLAYLLILFAMTEAPLSYIAPAREISMLAGVLIGANLLREGLTASRLLGTAAMVGGVILLALA